MPERDKPAVLLGQPQVDAKSGRITRGSAYRQGRAPGRSPLTVIIERARATCYHVSLPGRMVKITPGATLSSSLAASRARKSSPQTCPQVRHEAANRLEKQQDLSGA